MSDSNGLNIIVEDPKAQFLMQKLLGLTETICMLSGELGYTKVQLRQRLWKLYPTFDFDNDWIYDLINLRLRKVTLENLEKKENVK